MGERGPARAALALISPSDALVNLPEVLAKLPKAELHLHLEGSIEPPTVVELAARHGVAVNVAEAEARYNYADFAGFLDAFKWVTAFLRTPADYVLVAERLVDRLIEQRLLYTEITLSVGVMLLRGQNPEENFAALDAVAQRASARGLTLRWVFDAVRQFCADAAMEVARWAARFRKYGVVAFGMGGDELALPAAEFRDVYAFARGEGLHCLVHAGEVGGPQSVRDAIEQLGAERIGHGIGASADPELMRVLAERRIPLEICPTSNLRTGALAQLLGKPKAAIEEHPVHQLFERGVPITISTDDPAMFRASLLGEYALLERLGFSPREIAQVARKSIEVGFLEESWKRTLLSGFDDLARFYGLV